MNLHLPKIQVIHKKNDKRVEEFREYSKAGDVMWFTLLSPVEQVESDYIG